MPFARGLNVQRLRQFATGGAASIAFGVAATNILRIVSSMTLTRLLDSHAYGVVGVMTSVAFMITMLADIGLSGFIIRHAEGDDPHFLDQVWTIRLVRAIALCILMVVIAKPAAALLGKPELSPVVAIWGISFLLDGLSSLAFATAVRGQQLWRLSMLDFAQNVGTFIVSITIAILMRSYWAMVFGMIAGATVKTILSYWMFPATRRRWHFNRPRSAELWRFSRYIALSSILSLLILQSDKLVLARLMPLADFGLYAIAVTLATAPSALATPYAKRVLYATYAKTFRLDRPALPRVYYAARRKFSLLYYFLVGGMLGGAALIVAILYDPRYHAVTPFLQLISISVILRMSSLPANEAMIAVGRMRATFFANLCRIVWLGIGGAIGLWTHNIMLLVAIVGTVEVPGVLCYWWFLYQEKILNLREEGVGFAVAGVGIAFGWLVSTTALSLWPSL